MAIEVVNADNFADYVARNTVDPDAPVKITSGGESTLVDPATVHPVPKAKADEGKGGAFQERINELTRLRKEADEFAEGEYNARVRSDERIKALEGELEEARKATPKVQDDTEGKPDPKKYKEGEEQKYIDDLSKWHADRAVAKDRAEQEKIREQTRLNEEFQALVDSYNARVTEFKATHEDFQEVIDAVGDDPIRPWVRDTIMESENGPLLSYHLATNPSLRVSLNKMKANMACRELGRLESRLTGEVVKLDSTRKVDDVVTTRTRLPAPITPVTGGEATVDKDPRQPMPYAEYKRMRRAGKIT